MSSVSARARALSGLLLVCRVGLSALFIFAGASKLPDPTAFAVEIDHYELLPALAPYLAAALPVTEIVLGLALLLAPAIWRRAAALGCFVLMAAFTFAASAAVARGLDIDCGCFGSDSGPITWLTLARDAVLLLVCALCFLMPTTRGERSAAA